MQTTDCNWSGTLYKVVHDQLSIDVTNRITPESTDDLISELNRRNTFAASPSCWPKKSLTAKRQRRRLALVEFAVREHQTPYPTAHRIRIPICKELEFRSQASHIHLPRAHATASPSLSCVACLVARSNGKACSIVGASRCQIGCLRQFHNCTSGNDSGFVCGLALCPRTWRRACRM